MVAIGLKTSKMYNNRMVYILLILSCLFLYGCIFLFIFLRSNNDIYKATITTFIIFTSFVVAFICLIKYQKKNIFNIIGVKRLEKENSRELYNLVENLCISRGLTTPSLGIIEDDSLNAIIFGWSKQKSYLIFSKGILLKLTPKELEAVIAHELTHIINGDLKLTLLVNAIFMMQMKNLWKLWILPCTIINSKTSKIPPNLILLCVILFIFLAFPFLWLYSLYLFFILFLYILSLPFNITLHFLKKLIGRVFRRNVLLADIGSIELTKNKEFLISALKKIKTDKRIEIFDSQYPFLRTMFICNPSPKNDTHPNIDERIELLNKY